MPPVIAFVASVLVLAGIPAAIAGGVAIGVIIGTAVIAGTIILSVLLKPKTSSNQASSSRLNQQLDPDAFRKIILGTTALGNDEIYWEVYGTGSKSFDQVCAVAGHPITSFDALYLEGVLVPFSGANATGTYAGVLSMYTNVKGITATNPFGTTVGGGSFWTTASSMTGMAGRLFKWLYDAKKLPSGVPSRVCHVGKGSPIYDPRKDSTQGGSGTHRANDCTTWEFTPTDSNGIAIGRNNALQMLRYLLGWTTAGVRIDGRGVDPADIDYASFIAAANVCETQQYYTDCILSTGDTHSNNEAIIANGAQGVLLDSGGLWSYYPAYDDTASIAVVFTEDDIISGIQWNPKASMTAAYNRVGGNFVDPSTTNLYVPQPYPLVTDSTYLSNDGGFTKRLTLDFQNVQSAALAQKLARIALNKTRLTGTFQATFNYKALQAVNYNCVTLTFANLGFVAKLFRIVSMSINPVGGIDLTLQEENSSVYTGGTVNTYTPVAGAAPYDRTQQIDIGLLQVGSYNLNTTNSNVAYDAIQTAWTQTPNTVDTIEIEYQQSLIDTLDMTTWTKTNCTIGTGVTDRFSLAAAFSIQQNPANTNSSIKKIFQATKNYSTETITAGVWLKAGTATTNIDLKLIDGASNVLATNAGIILTSTWTFYTISVTVPSSTPNGLGIIIDPTNNTTIALNQTILFDDPILVDSSLWHVLPTYKSDRTAIIIPNVLPSSVYVVAARAISINGVQGPWEYSTLTTVGYTTPTRNKIWNQAGDPAIGNTVYDGDIWVPNANTSYIRSGGSWIGLSAAPSTLTDGTVLQTYSTAGTYSYTYPANALPHAWLEGWGAGGGGFLVGGKSYAYYGADGGGYFKHFYAITAGVTTVATTVGTGGAGGSGSTGGAAGTATTVTSPALTANGGGGTTNAGARAGSPGTATGGSIANTTGSAGQTPNTWSGGASPNGGATQNTQGSAGNAPGGGGSGQKGADGQLTITTKT